MHVTRVRTGNVNHAKVVTSHEFNGHVLPVSGRVGVTQPDDRASLASAENVSWAWFTRGNVGERQKRCGQCNESGECVRQHFLLVSLNSSIIYLK